MGMLFLGTEGWIYVCREYFRTSPEFLLKTPFGFDDIRLPYSRDHRRNFLDAVKTRQKPICPVDIAVRSDTVCHQADIAMRLGRPLEWDPQNERFVDDEQANRLLHRPMRNPWHI
jgi:hypothetical protein